jgi:hypothetical protein
MSTPRELLEQADRYRSWERAAEHARVLIRLGEKPKMSKGLFGFFKRESGYSDIEFDREVTSVIYDALADVRNKYAQKAKELEDKVTVVSES